MGMIKGQRAQTAIEIAVFGAILIFALGAIIRSSVSRGNQQNTILKATRLALTMSYDTSATMENASRNSASVLIVEDRLTTGSDKYGPIDRSPMLMSGSGSHSANMLMPVDFGDTEDIPLFDLFVNGKHFPLTRSAFKTIMLYPHEGSKCPAGQCSAQIWIDDPELYNVDESVLPIPVPPEVRYKSACTPCPEVQSNCAGKVEIKPCAGDIDLCTAGTCSDCSPKSLETYKDESGISFSCAKLYAIVDHHPSMEQWCDGGNLPCPTACSANAVPGCNLSADERFDLDRNDLDGIVGDNSVPDDQRKRFSWQWYLVMGFQETETPPPAANLDSDLPPDSAAIVTLLVGEGINEDKLKNMEVDVDQDLKMERIMAIYHEGNIISGFDVRDGQDGDVDFSFNDRDQGISPGFTKDINVYTEVRDEGDEGGTYLRIDEGKLFSADGKQYIRTASKKDAVDIIERVFKLSNDTGRLCLNGTPQMASVEACGNCHTDGNITRTCMDPGSLFLFIRSRISDYHGHKWVTDLSNDPHVEFLE